MYGRRCRSASSKFQNYFEGFGASVYRERELDSVMYYYNSSSREVLWVGVIDSRDLSPVVCGVVAGA